MKPLPACGEWFIVSVNEVNCPFTSSCWQTDIRTVLWPFSSSDWHTTEHLYLVGGDLCWNNWAKIKSQQKQTEGSRLSGRTCCLNASLLRLLMMLSSIFDFNPPRLYLLWSVISTQLNFHLFFVVIIVEIF